ncbi:MAG: hypothetical protein IJ289_06975 [Clostridia bacterium]|nr:hypothetical protein [Clostridia bacterium]
MKKKLLKIICVAVLCLVFGAASFFTAAHIGTDKLQAYFSCFSYDTDFSDDKPLSNHYFNILNDTEKTAYIAVFNGIRQHPEYIKIPELTDKEFNNVFFAVKNDNPDILCFADSCNMISFWGASFFHLTYFHDADECNRMMQEMEMIAEQMISDVSAVSDYEKELVIHDRMINHCEYSEAPDASNAYGFLVEKKAVCSGYSRAAMLLLNKVGMNSFVITGTAISPTEGEVSHMWNVVFIEGNPYHLDVTWDDPVSDSDAFLSHMYFNLTDEFISVDHKNYSAELVCNDSEYNYFVYNGTSFDGYNKKTINDISRKLLDNISDGNNFIEFVFNNDEAYNTAIDSMVNNSSSKSDMYIIMNTVASEPDINLDTSHVNFSMDDSRRYIRLSFDSLQK